MYSRAISGSANPLQVCLVVAFVKSLTMFVTVSFEAGITYFNSFLRRGPFVSWGVWGEGKTSTTRVLFFNYVYLHWNIQRQGKSHGTRQIQRQGVSAELKREGLQPRSQSSLFYSGNEAGGT